MFTYRQLLAFFIPLMLQTMSQTLTYPLVTTIVARGEYGSSAIAAFAQGQTVMFIIGTLAVGMITAGMMYALDRGGYRNFFRLNLILTAIITGLQILATCEPFAGWIFRDLFNLDAPWYELGRETLWLCIPAHICFMLRTPYQVALYNEREAAKANWATLGRVIVTALLSWAWGEFFTGGGVRPAVVIFTLPIMLEVAVSYFFARQFIHKLPTTPESASVRQQLTFCLPLTVGSCLLSLTGIMVAAFIGRTANAEAMLTVHYVVMGIITPLAFGGLRIQTVVISFFSSHGLAADQKIWRFALMVGVALGVISLLFQVPPLAQWYFGDVQNLDAEGIKLACTAILFLAPLPLLQALRSYIEGIAAWQKRSNLIFGGQIANLLALSGGLWLTFEFGVPGYLMGVIAVPISVLATHAALRWGLRDLLKNNVIYEAAENKSPT